MVRRRGLMIRKEARKDLKKKLYINIHLNSIAFSFCLDFYSGIKHIWDMEPDLDR